MDLARKKKTFYYNSRVIKTLSMSLLVFAFNCSGFFASKMVNPIAGAEIGNIDNAGKKLYYYTVGNEKSQPVVFLHGLLAFTEAYSELIERLSQRYYVIGIDLAGHGRSSIDTTNFSFNNIVSDILSVTNYLQIDRFHIVGHSAGGFLALYITKLFPDKVLKVVSIASLYNGKGINFRSKNDYLTSTGFVDNHDGSNSYVIKVFDQAYKDIDEKHKFDRTKSLMMKYGISMYPKFTDNDLMDIDIPTLVIIAENDTRIKPEHTTRMGELLPNSELLKIKGGRHFSVIKRKKSLDTIVEKIFQFL